MISDQDREVVAQWAKHGLPRDQQTLDSAPIVLARLVESHDEAWRAVEDVLDGDAT